MTLLEVRQLTKKFPVRAGVLQRANDWVRAVNGVSLHVAKGETLGIVGESGCGKTTLARLIVRLIQPDAGQIIFNGTDITKERGEIMRRVRRELQMVFQDPFGSLNPRMTIGDTLAEPFIIHRIGQRNDRTDRVAALLETVGLPADAMQRYPHQFSGGQRQRIGIARAIALEPQLVIADEPVSALDVSVQGEILNLLLDLQDRMQLSYILIAHDIKIVAQVSHRIAVMYQGEIVEEMPAGKILDSHHPYTKTLIASVPDAAL